MKLRSFLSKRNAIEWTNDRVLNCPDPTMNEYYEMFDIEDLVVKDPRKSAEKRDRLLLGYLNKNDEKIEVTLEELRELPAAYLKSIYVKLVNLALGLANDPN